MHTRRTCRTVLSGATAAGPFWFVLRNSLGTSNVPNLLCRAKTLWSCISRETRFYVQSRAVCLGWKEVH